jgi:hypothetical protein
MRLLRYRRPILKTALGVTKAKKQLKRDLGVYSNPMWKATHAIPNMQRRAKRRLGYYSGPMKLFRWLKR